MLTMVLVQEMAWAVPVPATIDGTVVALDTDMVVVEIQPLVAVIIPV